MKNFKILHEFNLTSTAITFLTYRFILLLKEKFIDWPAFKLGLIDKKGELLKKPKTKEEKAALDGLTNLVRKLKKILVKYIGDSKMLGILITAYLMKNEIYDPLGLEIEINSELTEEEQEKLFEMLNCTLEVGNNDPEVYSN